MLPVGFELTISAGERPQTYALERAATGTGTFPLYIPVNISNLSSSSSSLSSLAAPEASSSVLMIRPVNLFRLNGEDHTVFVEDGLPSAISFKWLPVLKVFPPIVTHRPKLLTFHPLKSKRLLQHPIVELQPVSLI